MERYFVPQIITGKESEKVFDLPPMIQNDRICRRCYQQEICFTYHKALENGTAITSGLGQLFESQTKHITERHSRFIKKWSTMIDLESDDLKKVGKEIWSMTGPQREKYGRCFSQMVLHSNYQETPQTFIYVFRRHSSAAYLDLTSLQISVGDYVSISTEDGHFSVSVGSIIILTDNEVQISCRKALVTPSKSNEKSL